MKISHRKDRKIKEADHKKDFAATYWFIFICVTVAGFVFDFDYL
ncbi:hypothetical protein [Bacillus weihaiensis]|nr:hypothetical protein [Bacillus weihaiensis]